MAHKPDGTNLSKTNVRKPPMGGFAPKSETMPLNDKIIRNKVGLLKLAEELGNVSTWTTSFPAPTEDNP